MKEFLGNVLAFLITLAVGFAIGFHVNVDSGAGTMPLSAFEVESDRLYVVTKECVEVLTDVATGEKRFDRGVVLKNSDRYVNPPIAKPFMVVGGKIVLAEVYDSDWHRRTEAAKKVRDEEERAAVRAECERLLKEAKECPKPSLPMTFEGARREPHVTCRGMVWGAF